MMINKSVEHHNWIDIMMKKVLIEDGRINNKPRGILIICFYFYTPIK